ncbi:efflux transporter periplasmic adaptor subunit [Acidihalobacter aeolianus]|uniref:Efflux transporter periplasmic adaptor subunit n=1 Tax=Acidihalobacter aeolianus TaxID=2792603 RepID=A0A1D8K562_9GAMM|nr:efflux RND transporter periplasmic adaptor subunit [Acidihalobacter aeolianus]AOV16099.1 efflux transporter periplasmic adaptor subunit [Acidihalobacter aeolianus]
MKKRLAIVIVVLVVLFGGIFGWKAFVAHKMAQFMAHMKMPPAAVSTATAKAETWHAKTFAVGTLSAVQGTNLMAQIAGDVTHIDFHSGEYVHAGQRLLTIDDSTQRAQLDHDIAQLKLAQVNLTRTRKLLAHHAASQAQLDTDAATLKSAEAAVASDRATLAKLNIHAPFSGHLGVRQVSIGQYVSVNTPLVDLQSWDPLYVNFTVPQSEISQVEVGTAVEVTVNAFPGKVFKGVVHALGSSVDPSTRQLNVQAVIHNTHDELRPGMFARVNVIGKHPVPVVVVPTTALAYNTYGDYVYVVEDKQQGGKTEKVAVQRKVDTGMQQGELVQIVSGLKAGDVVVTAGQVKLHNGATVSINNSVKP